MCASEVMAPNSQWMNEWSVAWRKVERGSSVASQKWCHVPPCLPPPAVYKTSSQQVSYRMARLGKLSFRHLSTIYHKAPFRLQYSWVTPHQVIKLCDIPSPTLTALFTRGFVRGTHSPVMCLALQVLGVNLSTGLGDRCGGRNLCMCLWITLFARETVSA